MLKNKAVLTAVYVVSGLVAAVLFGGLTSMLLTGFLSTMSGDGFGLGFSLDVFFNSQAFLFGIVEVMILVLMWFVYNITPNGRAAKNVLDQSKGERVEGALENSRFLTQKETDDLFPHHKYKKLQEEKEDGIPVYAVYDQKRKDVDLNIMSPAHGIIIGATGSGKTTTFINPVIQILGHSNAGSSMICTDPKGELFQLHSKMLSEHGYKCMVLDLRDPYSSFRWNPLGEIYDNYQAYVHTGDEIYEHTDSIEDAPELERHDPEEKYGETWYEYQGVAYADRRELINLIRVEKQKIYDACYEDLNDLISVICPIESQNDPVWEKGARSIIMATCLAMLEDSENPELEMTKEKFCFYNVNKAISNSEDEFAELKDFFKGRSKLSKAVGLSRQVLSAADQTLSSYMSIAFDKLSMFNDEGLCALTSATDIEPELFASEPTALFLKIPDEKDTRHALAAVFILCIYKALIKVASGREDLSLPRNVYFLLDEFGNMPKIEKFDKMITVGRSRKIWFEMVVQSFSQLNNVYGETIANIVKGNCGIKMFIGSNDLGTCEEFSKLCGNMSVRTTSVSSQTTDKTGSLNVSNQLQERPLIYPTELMKLNNKQSTGNAIIVTFGNYPLKTKFTPSYRCPLYEIGEMDLSDVRSNVFFGDDIYYDLSERNYLMLDGKKEGGEAESGEAEDANAGGRSGRVVRGDAEAGRRAAGRNEEDGRDDAGDEEIEDIEDDGFFALSDDEDEEESGMDADAGTGFEAGDHLDADADPASGGHLDIGADAAPGSDEGLDANTDLNLDNDLDTDADLDLADDLDFTLDSEPEALPEEGAADHAQDAGIALQPEEADSAFGQDASIDETDAPSDETDATENEAIAAADGAIAVADETNESVGETDAAADGSAGVRIAENRSPAAGVLPENVENAAEGLSGNIAETGSVAEAEKIAVEGNAAEGDSGILMIPELFLPDDLDLPFDEDLDLLSLDGDDDIAWEDAPPLRDDDWGDAQAVA